MAEDEQRRQIDLAAMHKPEGAEEAAEPAGARPVLMMVLIAALVILCVGALAWYMLGLSDGGEKDAAVEPQEGALQTDEPGTNAEALESLSGESADTQSGIDGEEREAILESLDDAPEHTAPYEDGASPEQSGDSVSEEEKQSILKSLQGGGQ